MKNLNSGKYAKSFPFSIIVLTFLVNSFLFAYLEIYTRSNAVSKTSCFDFLERPQGVMALWQNLFLVGLILLLISGMLILVLFASALVRAKMLHCSKRRLFFLIVMISLSLSAFINAQSNADTRKHSCVEVLYWQVGE